MIRKYISRRIKILRDSVALRIAAGEVIDRPFSVIRELLDNSIDAGADKIDVYVENGGVDHIRVIDNGTGMSRKDLEICCLPYSTSKIDVLEDLDTLQTLGFRGEALSSIAACSRLEITSKIESETPYKLIVHSSEQIAFGESGGSEGTIIDVSDLFYSIPARKKFLKRASAESTACRKTFIEKALPFPDIAFRFYSDKVLKTFLPVSTLKERVLAAYPEVFNKELLHDFSSEHKDFNIRLIAGDPAINRRDRRYIQIFLNNRRINEFSLVQAAEYGYSNFLPGGNYPVIFLFINVDPSLVDFNIHPAKKEVRIRNLPEIHRTVVDTIKSFLSSFEYNYAKSTFENESARDFTGFTDMLKERSTGYNPQILRKTSIETKRNIFPLNEIKEFNSEHNTSSGKQTEHQITYMGQLFNLFLLTAIDDVFYFIDQHAAHEKILFNELKDKRGKTQDLLIPSLFDLDREKESIFIEDLVNYKALGFSFEKLRCCQWQLTSIPEICSGKEAVIVDFVKNQKGAITDLETELYADLACKSAIKDGDVIDSITATELIQKTMELKNARCPHGRPVWFQVSREELFRFVGRI
ncbi:MAG: DNA mismatch repair endonuclease MutL [Spirochaetales bacterium]|nr:DNA mismatch repair endonuclease MutL [Spirochaetales bacterium]